MAIGRNRYLRDAGWIGFFILILASWAGLVEMSARIPSSAPDSMDWLARLYAVCSVNPGSGGLTYIVPMWLLMGVAMMAPTFVPSLRTYDDLIHTGAGTPAGIVALVVGYLVVWIGYSLFAALLQYNLATSLPESRGNGGSHLLVNAGLLLTAGIYQFSAIRGSCLSQCRHPFVFYFQHWKPGILGALRMGVLQGLLCAGCCWALMLLAFVGGAMSLLWMGIATFLMTLEKLPRIGRLLTRPVGYLCLFASALMVGRVLASTTF